MSTPAPLRELADRARPVTLAGEQLLTVSGPLASLFPGGGLRRGSTVVVRPGPAQGATTLAVALTAAASQAGSWCAAVGMPSLGLVMAAGVGVALERLALVANPGAEWPAVTAALLDAVDIVLVQPPPRFRSSDARRLAARARERGAVLLPLSSAWPEGADVRLAVTAGRWQGLGQGYGHLQGRKVEVMAAGRGAAARERRIRLWLPGPAGTVAAVADVEREVDRRVAAAG